MIQQDLIKRLNLYFYTVMDERLEPYTSFNPYSFEPIAIWSWAWSDIHTIIKFPYDPKFFWYKVDVSFNINNVPQVTTIRVPEFIFRDDFNVSTIGDRLKYLYKFQSMKPTDNTNKILDQMESSLEEMEF